MAEQLSVDPWVYAIGSGIVVALFAQLFVALSIQGRNKKRRKAYLNVVKHQLENNRKTMDELKNDLAGSFILPDFDVSIFHNFLVSDYMDIKKDKKFIDTLQIHLDNIGKYKIALQQIILYNAHLSPAATTTAESVKTSLTEALGKYKKQIEDCITEIKNVISKENDGFSIFNQK